MTRERNTKAAKPNITLNEQKKRTLEKLAKVINSDTNGLQTNYLLALFENKAFG